MGWIKDGILALVEGIGRLTKKLECVLVCTHIVYTVGRFYYSTFHATQEVHYMRSFFFLKRSYIAKKITNVY